MGEGGAGGGGERRGAGGVGWRRTWVRGYEKLKELRAIVRLSNGHVIRPSFLKLNEISGICRQVVVLRGPYPNTRPDLAKLFFLT